jgi:NAD(P)-dependent dehydrogenase (short-subunit alcohol dehydrogenase family)
MRKQRSGLIITISSTAGLVGFEFGTAYAASKFGLEGWMQSLQPEVEPFGINTITVNPGFFRTELLSEESANFRERTIKDCNERRAKQMEFWKGIQRPAVRRSRQTCQGIDYDLRSGKAAAALHCRCRCRWHRRASGRNASAAD